MNENTLASFGDNKDTWRTAALVMGFVLLISMAANFGGPSSANASSIEQNQLALYQQHANQQLQIGGFTTINDQPAFVILNHQGEQVGSLPMAQHNEISVDESFAESSN